MILRKFYIIIIVRVLLISLNCLILFFALQQPKHLFSIGVTGIVFIVQIVLLVRYLNKTNNALLQFYESIINQDSTSSLPVDSGIGNKELNKVFNEINLKLSNLRVEKEIHYQYLKHIIDHLDTGLISFDSEGETEFVNHALLKLLKANSINNIDGLNRYYQGLSDIIFELSPEKQKTIRIPVSGSILNLSIRVTRFKSHDKMIRLVSFHNINDEMNETEMKSWEKLIRVLTHEIMNSVSPINSLTTTLSRIYQSDDKPKSIARLNENDIKDTISGLSIIDKRSKGLMEFVKKYRQIYSIQQPVRETFRVMEVLEGIKRLLANDLLQKDLAIKLSIFPENLELLADRAMVEQVLINLIKNAYQALDANSAGIIEVIAFRNEGNYIIIQVKDNGNGIAPDVLDDIFVPFFTTKMDGSGIGLSLSRQIMQMHNGTIKVQSEVGKGSVFSLKF